MNIFKWIYKKLSAKKDKKAHDCLKLQWQIARLEHEISKAKRESSESNTA